MKPSPVNYFLPAFLALAPFLHPFSHAHASSPEAWDEFRDNVEQACRELADGRMTVETIRVDPFGTKSYGVAVLTEAGSGGGERVCVYDKQTGEAELSEPLQDERAPLPPLAEADRLELGRIPEQVNATLADLRAGDLPVNEQARTVEAMLGKGPQTGVPSGINPGPYACSVYWYGFLQDGAKRIGRHKCAVEHTGDGNLRISKFTGERINATTFTRDGWTAYAGRSFLSGHEVTDYDPERPDNAENANFGNKVGLVLRDGGRLLLVSIDERGMSPPDDTFFEIIELVPEA